MSDFYEGAAGMRSTLERATVNWIVPILCFFGNGRRLVEAVAMPNSDGSSGTPDEDQNDLHVRWRNGNTNEYEWSVRPWPTTLSPGEDGYRVLTRRYVIPGSGTSIRYDYIEHDLEIRFRCATWNAETESFENDGYVETRLWNKTDDPGGSPTVIHLIENIPLGLPPTDLETGAGRGWNSFGAHPHGRCHYVYYRKDDAYLADMAVDDGSADTLQHSDFEALSEADAFEDLGDGWWERWSDGGPLRSASGSYVPSLPLPVQDRFPSIFDPTTLGLTIDTYWNPGGIGRRLRQYQNPEYATDWESEGAIGASEIRHFHSSDESGSSGSEPAPDPVIDYSIPCCSSESGCHCPPSGTGTGAGPGGNPTGSPSSTPPPSNTGAVLAPVDPSDWTPLCTGGGLVPTAADPVDSEIWVS